VCVEQIESRVKSPEQSTSSRNELESEERLNKSGGAVLCCAVLPVCLQRGSMSRTSQLYFQMLSIQTFFLCDHPEC
jgi:hypothetical protein